ncbi:cardiolipin synthase [Singulisphaera acidiphila]|uniref:Cardiolipin synthase n=1 Tax=Singulisphaera acidiphila (strain ATCC BAA-1392 / DSM 18658 / VKM B-2454 / MOB10) TaxID=886293 RepID=L0DK36_SINAD|nr:cardiolipin synthase [Singulisphaera acidiphila]AGA29205.1 phosphatidylserine/phosphatidylglycerophosphate/cardiolipin synthase [Singulisphaera acidiphila DSM 18658]
MSHFYESNLFWLSWQLLTTLGFVLGIMLVAHLLKSQRSTSSTIAWLLVIVLVPYLGVPLYLMIGGRKMRRRAESKEQVYHRRRKLPSETSGGPAERILQSFGIPPATSGNRVELVTSGEEAYRLLLDLIDKAEHSIHITTYILGRGPVGEAIIERLAQRAADGVSVRLLLDDVGSWRVGRKFVSPLTAAGAKVAFFMPMLHLPFRGRTNLRNHRKIVVVDGQHALTGGMNLAEEYMGPTPDPERWRDFSLVSSGPAVLDLADLFRSDWKFATGETIAKEEESPYAVESNGSIAQVVASGPDVSGDPLYAALVSVAFAAKWRIWVVTPYFIPDETLARALELAARRGVDVRVIVPDQSNHGMADLARVSYLRQIQNAGGQVLLYQPGMVHAKVVLIDHDLAIVGSANMDMRSLFLNYEVAVFLYSQPQVDATAAWIETLMSQSQRGLSERGRFTQLAEDVVRLLSPLL